jgi:hypothetical protein
VGIVIDNDSGRFVIPHIKYMGLKIESESIYGQVIFCMHHVGLFWDLNVYQS